MSDNKHFDDYIQKLEYVDEEISNDSKKKILDSTMKKITNDSNTRVRKSSNRRRTGSYIAVACIILVLLSGIIPSTPIHALYQSTFQFISGFGVIETEEDTNIYLATEKAYKLVTDEGFVEVKYAYAYNNWLTISVVTDILSDNTNSKLKEYMIRNYSSIDELRMYFILDGEKKYLGDYTGNYSMTGPSPLTGAVNIIGNIEVGQIENNTFLLGMDSITIQLEVPMASVQESSLPSTLGSTLYIDDFLVFADVERTDDTTVVNISSVLPEGYKHLSAYLSDYEKGFFESGIYIIDEDGNTYLPNDELRELNNDYVDSFYFEIPEHVTGLTLKIPQLLYETEIIGETKVKVPNQGDSINVNESYSVGNMEVIFEKISLLTGDEDEIVNIEEFGEEALRLDFVANVDTESNHRVLKMLPHIKVKDGWFSYIPVSQHGYGPFWSESNQEGEYYIEFKNMSNARKIQIIIEAHNVIYGPFDIKLD